jgi:hypothetical protein
LDGTSDGFLDEVRGEFSFLSQFLIERIPCGRVRRNAVRVGALVPTELGGTVRTVKELAS